LSTRLKTQPAPTARGLGEHGIVAIPAAVANALTDALGADFYKIPITPQMVMEALESPQEGR